MEYSELLGRLSGAEGVLRALRKEWEEIGETVARQAGPNTAGPHE